MAREFGAVVKAEQAVCQAYSVSASQRMQPITQTLSYCGSRNICHFHAVSVSYVPTNPALARCVGYAGTPSALLATMHPYPQKQDPPCTTTARMSIFLNSRFKKPKLLLFGIASLLTEGFGQNQPSTNLLWATKGACRLGPWLQRSLANQIWCYPCWDRSLCKSACRNPDQ